MRPGSFRIEDWRIEPSLSRVESSAGQVRVHPKAMQVLVSLASRPGEVLSKEELLDEVWPDTFVTDAVLTSAIWELRKALNDDARNPTLIETIPKRGYRLIAPVTPATGAAPLPTEPAAGAATDPRQAGRRRGAEPADADSPPGRRRRVRTGRLAVAAAVVALAALAAWLVTSRPRRQAPAPPETPVALAVLPFHNNTGDPELDWLRRGIPDMLVVDLGRSSYLRVVSLEAVTGILGKISPTGAPADESELVAAVREQSGAQTVVTGRIVRDAQRFRILAQLHVLASGDLIAEEVEAEGPSEVLEMADRLGARIRIALEIEASDLPGVEEGIARTRTDSVDAYRLYVEGKGELERMRFRDAIARLRRAVEIDPRFAHAHELLANAYDILGEKELAREAILRAVESSERLPRVERVLIARRRAQLEDDILGELEYLRELVALEPREAQWRVRLGWFHFVHLRDCEQSLAHYREALELEPGRYPYFYAYYAQSCLACGQPRQALEAARRHAELLPGDASSHGHLGHAYLYTGDYARAIAELEAALEARPDFNYALPLLGDAHLAQGLDAEALEYFERYRRQALGPNEQEGALVRLGRFHLATGDADAAVAAAEEALEIDADSVEALWLLGLARLELGRRSQAEAVRNRLDAILARSESRRGYEYLHHLRGSILLDRGEPQAAVEAFAEAVVLHPVERSLFGNALAAATLAAGDPARAAERFGEVLAVNPNDARARCGRGTALERSGRQREAAREYEACDAIWKGERRPAWMPAGAERRATL